MPSEAQLRAEEDAAVIYRLVQPSRGEHLDDAACSEADLVARYRKMALSMPSDRMVFAPEIEKFLAALPKYQRDQMMQQIEDSEIVTRLVNGETQRVFYVDMSKVRSPWYMEYEDLAFASAVGILVFYLLTR